jgi:ribosomal protein S27AE
MAGDAFRSSAYACPVCANAPLRAVHDRLVCDECGGMLLAAGAFADSVREIDGSTDELELADTGRSNAKCPHCTEPMATTGLKLGALKLAGSFLRCAAHGLWVPREAMTAAYARASRRVSRGTGGGASSAAAIANMPSAHSGMSGAMASIAGAFGSGAPASLAISRSHQYRPLAHTLYVSAYKGKDLACPACSVALAYRGDRWACTTCHGVFVENEALVALVTEMVNAPWELPAQAGAPGERACPVCNDKLVIEQLEGATIDRCALHGVFFDDHELQQALIHIGTPPRGLGAWLKRLFGR